MFLNFIAGVCIAILAGMGVGGGGLLVIYLVFVLKAEQLSAQGLNLIFFICAAISSLVYHFRKREINIKLSAFLAVCGIIGAIAGAYTSSVINPSLTRKIFGWLLIVSGILTFMKKK